MKRGYPPKGGFPDTPCVRDAPSARPILSDFEPCDEKLKVDSALLARRARSRIRPRARIEPRRGAAGGARERFPALTGGEAVGNGRPARRDRIEIRPCEGYATSKRRDHRFFRERSRAQRQGARQASSRRGLQCHLGRTTPGAGPAGPHARGGLEPKRKWPPEGGHS
jgi:hypothetical protein